METPDYYKILDLLPHASIDQVWLNYQRLAREFEQADKVYDFKKFFLIEEAYLVLSHPQARQEYDAWLKQRESGGEKRKRTALVAFWTGFFSVQIVTVLLSVNSRNKTHVAETLVAVFVLFLLFSYLISSGRLTSII